MWEHELAGTHIMVPLDGSELAERALPVAAHVASVLGATLVLARITPPIPIPSAPPDGMVAAQEYQRIADDEQRAARAYLDGVALSLRERGLRVQIIAQQGVAAPALIELLAPLQIGLVVMTTHGRTGMALFALGSVADYLVRGSHVPVLLLRPLIEDRRCEQLEHAVVPLDGSKNAEAAVDLVAALSGRLIRDITLLRVVPTHDGAGIGLAMEEASHYLEDVSRRLSEQVAGGATVGTKVVGGDPAEQIIRRTRSGCDLLIMATRGERGTRRWVFGSVADRVLHDSGTPLMLIQPLGSEQQWASQPEPAVAHRPGTQARGGGTMKTEHQHEHEHEHEAEPMPDEQTRESGNPGGGKGRTDVPGHTGVYPVSASEGVSGEALVHFEPAWGQGERGAAGYEDSGESGVLAFAPQQEGGAPPTGEVGAAAETRREQARAQVIERVAPRQGDTPEFP